MLKTVYKKVLKYIGLWYSFQWLNKKNMKERLYIKNIRTSSIRSISVLFLTKYSKLAE